MLCEKCRQREATVHKQVIINGVAHSEHLCAECAAKARGGRDPFTSFFHNALFSDGFFGQPFSNWLEPFFQLGGQTMRQAESADGIGACPSCGMSWEDFQRNGFLGCKDCYDHFKEVLPPLMQELHQEAQEQTTSETAQAPMSAKAHLEQEMARAIETENFEEAARLRDAIKALEQAENGNGSPTA